MAINLTNLNFFMKNYPTMEIVPEQYRWSTLYDALGAHIQKDGFYGDLAEILIQTGFPYTATAFGENVTIPLPGQLAFIKQWIPLKQVIVNAGLTMQMMDRATGGNTSWDNVVTKVLEAQRQEFKWLMELVSIGDGSGRLCRTGLVTGSTNPVLAVDNCYTDYGWDNTALLKVGMRVEFWSASGVQLADTADGYATHATAVADEKLKIFTITSITAGVRDNIAATSASATDGSITLGSITGGALANDVVTTDWGDTSSALTNGGQLYLYGTRSKLGNAATFDTAGTGSGPAAACYLHKGQGSGNVAYYNSLPVGLTGLIANGADTQALGGFDDDVAYGNVEMTTFQGLARTSYPTLKSAVYTAGDFGGTLATPADWDLSVISDAMNQINSNTGKWTNLLICSSQLALAIQRRNKAESSLQVTVSAPQPGEKALAQTAGSVYANSFLRPDGAVIPIMVSKTIPRNVIYGLCTEDLRWFTKGNFGFLRLNGDIWDKSYNDRYANFEAPFGGYSNIGAERCDTSFRLQDMKDNI